MRSGNIRHFFPGGNTPKGFFSYYQYIVPPDANRIFVLKGGPGVGKSTFMRKIGQAFSLLGYDIEQHHCSSDNNSLDGVVVPALNIALIDGTAPHVVDPKYPGCVDEIINLGQFWDENKLVQNKAHIISIAQDISNFFAKAYRYLKAAKAVYDDWEAINQNIFSPMEANAYAKKLLNELIPEPSLLPGAKIRKMFASAITPDGSKNYLSSLFATVDKLYVVIGDPGTGKSTLVQRLADKALLLGYNIEAFYCPFDPEKIEHLIIPALSTGIITSTPAHSFPLEKAEKVIDMNNCLNQTKLSFYKTELLYVQKTYNELFDKAISCINNAKQYHDTLETYYVPSMNFEGIGELWEKTLKRIMQYEHKK